MPSKESLFQGRELGGDVQVEGICRFCALPSSIYAFLSPREHSSRDSELTQGWDFEGCVGEALLSRKL